MEDGSGNNGPNWSARAHPTNLEREGVPTHREGFQTYTGPERLKLLD